MEKKYSQPLIVGIVIAIFLGLAACNLRRLPFINTANQVAQMAALARQGEDILPQEDSWGNAIRLDIKHRDTDSIYTCISAGKDGEFDTEDDISATEVELHKSRIVGKWIGKKSVEAAKGVFGGVIEGIKGGPN